MSKRNVAYRYFVYYETQLESGLIGYHHTFLEIDAELNDDRRLNDVEKFLLNQHTNAKSVIVKNFVMVGIFEKENKESEENGEHN